jgi:PKD repeat protein
LEVQFNNTSNDAAFYFWKFGDGNTNYITNPSNYYTHPGNYSVTLIAYNPTLCGLKIDTLILHNYITVFPPPNIIITQSNDTLTSNFSSGNQWYDYGILIPGATSQQFIAHTTGCYQTTYTDSNGCSNISNMICVEYAGIHSITTTNGITIYPNPLSDKATIIIDGKINNSNTSFGIYNLLGQELQRIELPANQGKTELSIDRTDIPNGLYFYKIINSNSEIIATGKLIFM